MGQCTFHAEPVADVSTGKGGEISKRADSKPAQHHRECWFLQNFQGEAAKE